MDPAVTLWAQKDTVAGAVGVIVVDAATPAVMPVGCAWYAAPLTSISVPGADQHPGLVGDLAHAL
jgi:hypothetical protein